MPYTKKTAAGNWKCQYYVDGQRRCVTASSRKQAEYLALQDQLERKRKKEVGCTVGEAVRQYIDARDAVLSPSTVQAYERMLNADLDGISKIPVSKFTSARYQKFVNELSGKTTRRGTPITPKAVRNICGLLTAALRWTDPDIKLDAALPPPRKRLVEMLSPEAVISIVRGSSVELPVLLAMWLSLSLSEIRGLTVQSVRGEHLYVQGAVVDIDGMPVHKEANKAYDRTRALPLPQEIRTLIERTDAWKAGEGYLVPMSGRMIYKNWIRLQMKAGVEQPMCFHQLRHLNASVMLALGVPDTYAMTRGGWSSRQTLNNVYQHTLESRRASYDRSIDSFFSKIYAGS